MLNKIYLLFFVVFLILVNSAYSAVEINGFVNDYANILSAEEKGQIEYALQQIYDSGVAQYSIVTINSLEGRDIESYALSLAQGKLGDSEKNNGLLLLVAVDDRKYRFEVGRGIEYILNDAKVGRIGRTYLVENFRAGDYGKGILGASFAVKSILLEENSSEYYPEDCVCAEDEVAVTKDIFGKSSCSCEPWATMLLLFILPPLFFLGLGGYMVLRLFRNLKANAKKIKGSTGDKYFDAAQGAVILFGGRGGQGGFGGFGGGGFGGGGFGGGGASGGW